MNLRPGMCSRLARRVQTLEFNFHEPKVKKPLANSTNPKSRNQCWMTRARARAHPKCAINGYFRCPLGEPLDLSLHTRRTRPVRRAGPAPDEGRYRVGAAHVTRVALLHVCEVCNNLVSHHFLVARGIRLEDFHHPLVHWLGRVVLSPGLDLPPRVGLRLLNGRLLEEVLDQHPPLRLPASSLPGPHIRPSFDVGLLPCYALHLRRDAPPEGVERQGGEDGQHAPESEILPDGRLCGARGRGTLGV